MVCKTFIHRFDSDRRLQLTIPFRCISGTGRTISHQGAITTSGKPLDEEVFLLEHELIKHALENAQGRVTFAARSLGMGHQKFTHKLNTKHKDLLKYRKPSQQRKPEKVSNAR